MLKPSAVNEVLLFILKVKIDPRFTTDKGIKSQNTRFSVTTYFDFV